MARRFAITVTVGLLLLTEVAHGQRSMVELKLEAQTLELGEAIDLQLVCTNTGTPGTPEAAVPQGLDLKLLNATPFSSSVTQIINGRRTDRVTYTYSMRLTALQVGTYTFGPITVAADAQSYQTKSVQITVRNTESTASSHGDRYMFVELTVTPTSLYVTESLTATLTFGIRKVVINGRTYNIEMLRSVLDSRASTLSVFADGRARVSQRFLTDAKGQRHEYEVFKVTKIVRTDEVGKMSVGPVFLKANYPTAIRRGFFNRYEISRARKETARTDAIVVDVKAPPDHGRPADFMGSIGRFTMDVSAKPLHVEQGQPVTLTISIRGTPVQGVAGPDLTQQPELASRYDYSKDELVGDMENGAKVFRRAVFPKLVGEQTIPSISWSFFDTRREQYVTLASDPIDLTVDPPTATPTTITLLNQPESMPKGSTLTLLRGGILPNFVDADSVLANQTFSLTLPWIVILVVSPLTWLIVTLTTRHRVRLRTDVRFARRRRARRVAHARISQALRNGDPVQQWHELAGALTGYISDRFNHPADTLTSHEARSLLATNKVGESTTTDVAAFLETSDTVRYAAGVDGEPPASAAAAGVRRWIERIEKDTC